MIATASRRLEDRDTRRGDIGAACLCRHVNLAEEVGVEAAPAGRLRPEDDASYDVKSVRVRLAAP
jgi:hypothetical protein